MTLVKPTRILSLWCLIIASITQANAEKILNGQKRVIIYPDDSHNAAAAINRLYLDRYFGR